MAPYLAAQHALCRLLININSSAREFSTSSPSSSGCLITPHFPAIRSNYRVQVFLFPLEMIVIKGGVCLRRALISVGPSSSPERVIGIIAPATEEEVKIRVQNNRTGRCEKNKQGLAGRDGERSRSLKMLMNEREKI